MRAELSRLEGEEMGKPSLAERLGYGPKDRLLIVNCDDLGSSHSANIATFRSTVYGVATSATLMVTCPWAREAARKFKGLSVGVHLTLTCEYRGYRWRGLTKGASLHDEQGFLPATGEAVAARIDAKDARAECRSQIETALSWGLDVTHLDSHMYALEARSDLFDLYLDLAEEFRLPAVRGAKQSPGGGCFDAKKGRRTRCCVHRPHDLPVAETDARRILRGNPEAVAGGERNLRPPSPGWRGTARL